jgi:hypothetical protein
VACLPVEPQFLRLKHTAEPDSFLTVSPENFTKLVKGGNATIPVIQIVVTTTEGELKRSGALELTPGRFTLRFACLEGRPPELREQVIHREQFWTLTGRFMTGLNFTCRHVPPPSSWSGLGLPMICGFNLESIEFEAQGFDRLTYDEFEKLLARADAPPNPPANQEWIPIKRDAIRHTGIFHILVAGYPLLFGNEEIRQMTEHPFLGESGGGIGRVLKGTAGKFEYCLSEVEGDLAVDVRSKNGELTTEAEEHTFLDALLETISFTHGQQIRRFHSQYWRDHKLVENCFRPILPTARTSNVPFPERLCFAGVLKEISFHFPSAFDHVLQFFSVNDSAHFEIRDYLAELQHASAKGINPSHARLAVCRVFEGVVDLLFDDLKLGESPKTSADIMRFERAKTSTARWLSKKKRPAFKRLQSFVRSAKALTTIQKYQAIVRHFGFKPDGITAQILADWNSRRHLLAHGRSDTKEGNAENLKAWLAQSRIAGGINLLILKRSGYSGKMRLSFLENTYVDI